MSISGVSMSEIKVYSASVDDHDPGRGYVIQATVTNGNDVSCDVTPDFAVDITGPDDYGAEQTRRAIIYGNEVFTPYGLDSVRDMQPVGLAPHETKDVRYYVYLDGADPLLALPLSDDGETGDEGDGTGLFGAFPLESDGSVKYYSGEVTSLANAELVSFSVEEAGRAYLPADEWSQSVTLSEEYDDGTSWGGYPTYKSIITGSITNPTQDRWLSAKAQFDFSLNGQTLNEIGIRGTYYTFDHVDVGASEELQANSIAISQSDYNMSLMPALLAYEPD